jgi:hypothetical protein
VWCCVDPQYSLLHGATTSFLETVPIFVTISKNTKTVAYKLLILKQCVDNLTIKSVKDMYTKRFTQLNSYGRACNNVLAVGTGEVDTITNNIVGLCSYNHTNVTLTYSNWEITRAERIVAGYSIQETVLTALKIYLEKDRWLF